MASSIYGVLWFNFFLECPSLQILNSYSKRIFTCSGLKQVSVTIAFNRQSSYSRFFTNQLNMNVYKLLTQPNSDYIASRTNMATSVYLHISKQSTKCLSLTGFMCNYESLK